MVGIRHSNGQNWNKDYTAIHLLKWHFPMRLGFPDWIKTTYVSLSFFLSSNGYSIYFEMRKTKRKWFDQIVAVGQYWRPSKFDVWSNADIKSNWIDGSSFLQTSTARTFLNKACRHEFIHRHVHEYQGFLFFWLRKLKYIGYFMKVLMHNWYKIPCHPLPLIHLNRVHYLLLAAQFSSHKAKHTSKWK